MSFPFKFPRRVRIHGGECGAVARALHHEAQKNALIPYERVSTLLISDEKAFSRQADSGKSSGSTILERKQMSTKTSIKRIALVAVSALGFGLLSVVPAKAAATATVGPVRVSFTDNVRDVVAAAAFTVTPDASVTAAGTNDSTLTVTQAPTSTAEVTVVWNGHTTKDTLGGNGTQVSDTTLTGNVTSGTAIAGTIAVSSAPVSGTYKGTLVIQQVAATSLTINWSFTTTGKVATINTDASSYSMPALVQTGVNTFLSSKVVSVTLKDSAGNTTQAATGDSITTSITSATNINTKVAEQGAASADLTFTDSNLNDGAHTFRVGAVTAVADSETVTLTPAGIMPAQGVVAKTFTVTTAAASDVTNLGISLTTPSSSTVVKTVTGTPKSYNSDPSVASFVFAVTGLEAGKGYRIYVVSDDGGTQTAKDDVDNTTAATINDDGSTATELFGIVPASGTVNVTVAGAIADTKFIKISANDNDYADAVDSVVTAAAPVYRVKITSPTVTPSMDKIGAAITASGDVLDQYGNPVVGATVSLLGEPTTTDASPANLTASATSSSTGSWTATLGAATALTTAVDLSATAVKTGVTVQASTTSTANNGKLKVNLTTSGSPTTITFTSTTGDEGTAATATKYPAIYVMYEGAFTQTTDLTDADYTIATGLSAGLTAGEDMYTAITPTTTPGAQVVVTGTDGLSFATTDASASLSTLKSTVTVASASPFYVFATKAGTHTVTMTSGATVKTVKVVAYENEAGARNISAVASSLTLKPSAFGTIQIKVTDAFGNIIKSGTSVSIAYASTGAVNLEGPSTSKSTTTTDANGIATIGVVAGGLAGTGTITVTASGDQFGAAAGSLTTTAGTNTMSASVKSATIAVTVEGSTAKTNDEVYTQAVKAEDAAKLANTTAGEAKTEAAAATTAATTAGTKADAAKTEAVAATTEAAKATAAATTAGTKADAAKTEAAAATAAATKAGTDAVAAADAAKAAAAKAGTDAVAAADAAKAEAAKATAAAAANAVEIAKILAAVTALKSDTSAADAYDAALEAIDAANGATDAAQLAMDAADAATVAAEEARDAADAATAAVEELATQVSTLIAGLKAQLTTLANTVAKIAKKVKA